MQTRQTYLEFMTLSLPSILLCSHSRIFDTHTNMASTTSDVATADTKPFE
jgi:hypothetical protein